MSEKQPHEALVAELRGHVERGCAGCPPPVPALGGVPWGQVREAPDSEAGVARINGEVGTGEEAVEQLGAEGAVDDGAAEGGDVVFVVGGEEGGVDGEEEAGEGMGAEEKVEEGGGGEGFGDFVEDLEGEGDEGHWLVSWCMCVCGMFFLGV